MPDGLMGVVGYVALLWLASVSAILLYYRQELYRILREPVWRIPVLVLESDDWGAGPLEQAKALDELAGVLRRYRDESGRMPVMSLAIVLAVPDGRAIEAEPDAYRRRILDQAPMATVLEALKRGESERVFALQLHGLEHFWPEALVASQDPQVRSWLREPGLAATERLPPHLQSRWVDASRLPSRPLPDDLVQCAVKDEVQTYQRVIGCAPTIVVPPTFVWTLNTERAWAANGIEFVVTSGHRYVALAADGSSVTDGTWFANGDHAGGITYLVRYDYFEPARGRNAEYALRAFRRAGAERRPCILETHRINFCAEPGVRADSLNEVDKLVSGALKLAPDLRFLSSDDVARILVQRDPGWIVLRWQERLPYICQRLHRTGRLWKLLKLSGAALLGELLARWVGCLQEPARA